jgi:putative transposase
MGVKESLLVERDGGPLAVVVVGANVNDHLVLEATLNAIVVERPIPCPEKPQNLCLDKGYDNAPSRAVVEALGYVAHIKRIGEEKLSESPEVIHPARRWVVERTLAWLFRWRGILIRWEKLPGNYIANVKLACALLWMRRAWNAGSELLG